MAESTIRGIISFFDKLGIYDVVLPFLLVFTIVFAVMEKTRILGTEKVGNQDVTKKNLNAMVAFVLSFLVVASTKLVRAINESMANIVLLLLLSIGFIMLLGSFHPEGEFHLKDTKWAGVFGIIMFIGILLIFMNAIGWLHPMWDYLKHHWNDTAAASGILLLVIIGFIFFITKDSNSNDTKKKNGENGS